ncbi:hypothetical protein K488DRAFT_86628 [Vararia minispora EC-137]|uniref:Uncharacterized protein n=1 Tax=Vararia minispora EC-137 TaxID=1314806 RepID=A0ACB8QJ39_9AGAM|nr:hypothetical protein K488DRAFT_86628 [Vararia minispora EC-137]
MSSSSEHRSESPLSPLDEGDASSQTSGVESTESNKARRLTSHDADASATEALLSLRMEPRTHSAGGQDGDRRASWQRLPNVSLAPRLRRKLGDAYSADDEATYDETRTQGTTSARSSTSSDDDERSALPYAHDVTSAPPASKAPPAAASRAKRTRPQLQPAVARRVHHHHHHHEHEHEREDGATEHKLRRKTGLALEARAPSPPSPPDTDMADAFASPPPVPPRGDALSMSIGAAMTSSAGGRRHRHVPDAMQHIACYFCRRRKIKCGPPAGSDKSCPCVLSPSFQPCAKRQLPCEYAEKSNRGMRTDLIRKKQSLALGASASTSASASASVSGSASVASASPPPPAARAASSSPQSGAGDSSSA